VRQDKTIRALHRKHLLYLIDYIEADLRETPEQSYQDFCGTATQSDMLPKFMKQAKNRETILRRTPENMVNETKGIPLPRMRQDNLF
jgi:hypothetical protein